MNTKETNPSATHLPDRVAAPRFQPPQAGASKGPVLNLLRRVAVGVAGFVGLTGCVGVHHPHPTGPSGANALHCDKCRTTWVTRAEPSGRVTRFSRAEAMVCEDCESAVLHWLKTGTFKHYCSHCKGNMTCDPERPGAAAKK